MVHVVHTTRFAIIDRIFTARSLNCGTAFHCAFMRTLEISNLWMDGFFSLNRQGLLCLLFWCGSRVHNAMSTALMLSIL